MSTLTPAEQKVRKLARLPSNCKCPNCGLEKKFGFSTICIKFFTFVCNECKSSHQAISHRCKSLTMSSWEMDEVLMLEQKGNDYARRTWLKHAPPYGTGGRPQPGDDISVYKNFVLNAYDRRKYYGEDDGFSVCSSAVVRDEVSSTTTIPSQRVPSGESFSKSRSSLRSPAAPPPPQLQSPAETDLLDFGAALAVPYSSSSAASTTGTGVFGGEDDFGSFQSFPSTTPAAQPSVTKSGNNFDAFGSSNTTTTSASSSQVTDTQSSFDPFGNSQVPATRTSNNNTHSFDSFGSSQSQSSSKQPSSSTPSTNFGDFDVFAGTSTTASATSSTTSFDFIQPQQPNNKTPVMGNIMGNNAGCAISGMDFISNNSNIRLQQQGQSSAARMATMQQPKQQPTPMMNFSTSYNNMVMMNQMNMMMGNMNMKPNSNMSMMMGNSNSVMSGAGTSGMMMMGRGMNNNNSPAPMMPTPMMGAPSPPMIMETRGGGGTGPMMMMNSPMMSRPSNLNSNRSSQTSALNSPSGSTGTADKFADLCKF